MRLKFLVVSSRPAVLQLDVIEHDAVFGANPSNAEERLIAGSLRHDETFEFLEKTVNDLRNPAGGL